MLFSKVGDTLRGYVRFCGGSSLHASRITFVGILFCFLRVVIFGRLTIDWIGLDWMLLSDGVTSKTMQLSINIRFMYLQFASYLIWWEGNNGPGGCYYFLCIKMHGVTLTNALPPFAFSWCVLGSFPFVILT